MALRDSLEIKKTILKTLKDGKSMSFAELERKVNTNWRSIRNHCKELKFFGCVSIVEKEIHNKLFYEVKITEYGIKLLKK